MSSKCAQKNIEKNKPLALQMRAEKLPRSRKVGMALVDDDGAWAAANNFLLASLGVNENAFIGRQMRDYVSFFKQDLTNENTAENNYNTAWVYLHCSNGKSLLAQAAYEQFCSHYDGYYITFFLDRTEDNRLFQSFDCVSSAKQTLATVAHDIRSPLTAIMTSCELLENLEKDEKSKSLMQIMSRNVKHASRIVDDLVDVYRWTGTQKIRLEHNKVNLGLLLEELLESYNISHPNRAIHFHRAGDLNGVWDSNRLHQMMSNLVNNALTHARPANKSIKIYVRGLKHSIWFKISNMGEVIPKNKQQKIFEPFFKSSTNGTNEAKCGLGLGLFIVRTIVNAHDGKIFVRSSKAGTRFIINLPRSSTGGGLPPS